MKWFELYRSEFGRDINDEFSTYETEFAHAFGPNMKEDEVNRAIRDLKQAHAITKCYEIRLPGPSDIVRQIKRNRRKGDGGKRYMEWMQSQIKALKGDVERFNAICDPVGFLGARRDTRPEEIVILLSWAKQQLGFDERAARAEIAESVKDGMEDLKRTLGEVEEAWTDKD